ncbi:MAG: FAD-dependent monooxygenase [Myxococcales bacterium]|nr:FAD-dependent monooxygenase [Myxococcales bacterium]
MTPQVLIVGAGPVGLSLSLMLLRHGISVRMMDKNEGPSVFSKAQVIHARTMEAFHELGVIAPFVLQGRHVAGVPHAVRWHTDHRV